MPTRVVVWGTGVVGSMVIAEIIRHPEYELVGVGVHDPAKVGRDAGELADIDPVGVLATDDLDELIALRPDGVPITGPPRRTPIRTLQRSPRSYEQESTWFPPR